MMTTTKPALLLAACGGPGRQEKRETAANTPAQTVATPATDSVPAPAPYATKSVSNHVSIQPWPAAKRRRLRRASP